MSNSRRAITTALASAFILSVLMTPARAQVTNEARRIYRVEVRPIKVMKDWRLRYETRKELVAALGGNDVVFVRPGVASKTPMDKPWRPLRHFGPFVAGSDLGQIQLLAGSSWTLYFNSFFSNHPSAAIYQRCFGASLPQNAAPDLTYAPGGYPAAGYSSNQPLWLLRLDSLAYSSKYGGSLRLRFAHTADTGLELRQPATTGNPEVVWDLKDVVLDAYASLVHTGVNPTNPNLARQGAVHPEITYSSATQYEGTARALVTLDDARLTAALQTWTQGMTSVRAVLLQFAHGFLHEQFQDMIAANEAVDSLELSDDYANLTTHVRQPTFSLYAAVIDVASFTDLLPIGDEHAVGVDTHHVYSDGQSPRGPHRFFRIDAEDLPLSFKHYGTWYAPTECDFARAVLFQFAVRERDSLFTGADDRFERIEDTIALPTCSEINTAAADNLDKTLSDFVTRYTSEEINGTMHAFLGVQYRLYLRFR